VGGEIHRIDVDSSDGQYVIITADVSERSTVKRDSVTTNKHLYDSSKIVGHNLQYQLKVASVNVEPPLEA